MNVEEKAVEFAKELARVNPPGNDWGAKETKKLSLHLGMTTPFELTVAVLMSAREAYQKESDRIVSPASNDGVPADIGEALDLSFSLIELVTKVHARAPSDLKPSLELLMRVAEALIRSPEAKTSSGLVELKRQVDEARSNLGST